MHTNMNKSANLLAAALLLCPHCTLAAPSLPADAGTASSASVRCCPEKRSVDDVMPFYWKGEYHVFYLLKNSGNADIDWEHAVSNDLVHWRNLPAAILHDPADKTGPEGGCMFTGSIIEHQGTFHAFYTSWNPENPAGREFICHATSKDLISWTKQPKDMFGPDGMLFMKPVPEVVNVLSEVALSDSNLLLVTGTTLTKKVPQNYLLEATVDMSKGREFGLTVRGDGIADACRIVLSSDKKMLMTTGGQAWESRPLPVDFAHPVTVQALILKGVAEVFVNSQYAATSFISQAGGALDLESRGSVVIRSLQVRTTGNR